MLKSKLIFGFLSLVSFIVFFKTDIKYENQVSASKNTFSSKLSKGIPPERNWVKIKLSNMTLREKIGQMIISSTFGEVYDEKSIEFRKLKRLCEETRVGGFIFFKGTSSGYARLSNKLQEMSETPLLISADFERGTGMRVTDGTLFPNNMAIGATRNHELTYEMGLLVARESRILGVHQNYSPVCDVNNNQNNPIINVRSFGEDPILVSQMSEMMIKGLQEGKVIATAKHFPGHGDTDIDSHSDLPILYFSQERLNSVELVPFKNAIDRKVMSVMVAHLSVPELDPTPNIPSSLSNDIVEGLLIKRLGFDGLIVTDALNMKGITKYFSTSEVAVMSVNAGIDLILMPLDEKATIDAIEKAVKNGIISEERINKSAEKILKAKEWLGLSQNKYVNSADVYKSINTEESNNLSQKIADESITLVKDINNAIPIKRNNDKIIVFNLSDGKDNINSSYFNSKLAEKFPNLNIVDINSSISENTINEYSARASENEYIIIAIYAKVKFGTGKISILSSHIDLINDLSKNGKIIIISFGNPYLLKEFPATPCYICAYGDADVSINSLLKAISGEIKIGGKLPVSINDDYKYGTGISK